MFPFPKLKKSRSSEAARGAERYEALAETALDEGDFDGAVDYYQAALEFSPFNDRLRHGLADALMLQAEQQRKTPGRRRSSGAHKKPVRSDFQEPKGGAVRSARKADSGGFDEHIEAPPRFSGMAAMDDEEYESRRSKQKTAPAERSDSRISKSGMRIASMGWDEADDEEELEIYTDDDDFDDAPLARREHRMKPSPGRRRPRKRRFAFAAAAYTVVILSLLGVAHAVISQAVDKVELPEVPKVEKLPEGVTAALESATSELAKGRPEPAIKILEQAAEQYPKQKELLNAALAKAMRSQGNLYLDSRDYDKAAVAFERATRVNPLDADNWIELGRSFREHGRSVQASNPSEGQKLLERARDAYQRAFDVEPDEHAALVGLGQVYTFMGHRSEAVDQYKKVVAASPDSKEAALARRHLAQLVGQ